MAMAVGTEKGMKSEMNVVPLIDVLLVLLVIFMVMVPYASVGLSARAPVNEDIQSHVPDPGAPVVVQVAADGLLRINHEPVSWDKLSARLEEIFSRRAEKVAFVQGEDQVRFGEVARAVSAMRSAGIEQVGLLGSREAGGAKDHYSP